MKKTKKNTLLFGVTLIALLMAPSATAIGVIQSDKRLQIESNTTCVEPGIYISGSEQRKILSDSLSFITNHDACLLVQAIIAEMDLKGYANSEDVQQIVNEYNLEFSLIAGIGAPITTGDSPNPGHAIWVGHPFQNSGTIRFGVLFWTAKHSLNPARDVNITITLDGVEGVFYIDKSGFSIGFSGAFADGQEQTGHWFTVQGSALMHIVF